MDLERIPLGYDRFEAQVIAESCRAEGLKVELLLMDEGGNVSGLTALEPHVLLVRAVDVDAVEAVLSRQ